MRKKKYLKEQRNIQIAIMIGLVFFISFLIFIYFIVLNMGCA